MARWWRWWGSRGGQVPPGLRVHPLPPTRRAGWCWRAASVSYGKATPYLPVIDLLKRYCQHRRPRRRRARSARRSPGTVLTLDEALQADPAGAPRAPGRAGRTTARSGRPRSAATPPAHPRGAQAAAAAREPGAAPAPGLRGPALDRRRDPGAARQSGREPADGPHSCCWSTTARSTSTAGAARPTTRNSGSTRCRPRAPTNSCRPCWGTTPAWRRSSSC